MTLGRMFSGRKGFIYQSYFKDETIEVKRGGPRPAIPNDFHEFNKLIGLPLHPRKKVPVDALAPFQMEINTLVEQNSPANLLINKSKKIGLTDVVLRIIAHKCFTRYMGPPENPGEVMLVAGNRCGGSWICTMALNFSMLQNGCGIGELQ